MASTISTNSLWPRILQHTPGMASSSQLRSFGHQAINIDPTWALFLAPESPSKTRKFEPPSALIGALEVPQSPCQFPEFSPFILSISHPFLDQFPQLLDHLRAPVSLFLLTPFIIFIGPAGHPLFFFFVFLCPSFFLFLGDLLSTLQPPLPFTLHPSSLGLSSIPPFHHLSSSVPGSSPSSSPSSPLCMSRSLDIPG